MKQTPNMYDVLDTEKMKKSKEPNEIMEWTNKLLSSFAFYRMREYTVDDDFWGRNDVEGSITRLRVLCSRFVKSKSMNGHLMRFHISSNIKSAIIDIATIEHMIMLTSIIIDNIKNVGVLHSWSIEPGEETLDLARCVAIGDQTHADMISERAYDNPNREFIGNINDIGDTLEAMRLIRADTNPTSVKACVWSNTEWRLISQTARIMFPNNSTAMFEIGGGTELMSLTSALNNVTNKAVGDPSSLYDVADYIKENNVDTPIISCKKREWEYIINYGKERGLSQKSDKVINLSSALKSPRFGQKFLVDYPLQGNPDEAGPIQVFMGYMYKEEEDDAKFVINLTYQSISIVQYAVVIECHNISEFRMDKSVVSIWGMVAFVSNVHTMLASGLETISKRIPSDPEGIGMRYMEMFLSFMMITHDRPEKMRSVREEASNPEGESSSKSPTVAKQNHGVRHIMTAASVKKYVSKMSTDKTRIYSVESWKRSGHWRQYKSGKRVWIAESECTRHLKTTKRKEYIKL